MIKIPDAQIPDSSENWTIFRLEFKWEGHLNGMFVLKVWYLSNHSNSAPYFLVFKCHVLSQNLWSYENRTQCQIIEWSPKPEPFGNFFWPFGYWLVWYLYPHCTATFTQRYLCFNVLSNTMWNHWVLESRKFLRVCLTKNS